MFLLTGCEDESSDKNYYYPEILTVHFYDAPDAPPISSVTVKLSECDGGDDMAHQVWKRMPTVEKAGYKLQGYVLSADEDYPLCGEVPFDSVMLKTAEYMATLPSREDFEKYYSLYYELYSEEQMAIREINLYANYVPDIYKIIFDGLSHYGPPSGSQVVQRVDRPDELAKYNNQYKSDFRATIDYVEYAPGGFNATQEVAGWATHSGELIFDYMGRPVLTAYEMYLKFTNYGQHNEDGWKFRGELVTLYPILVDKFSVITIDHGIVGVHDYTFMASDGQDLGKLDVPRIYLNGKYAVSFSTSPDENVAPTGPVNGDITLYPIWMQANKISISYPDATEPFDAYVLSDGRILFDTPDGLERYEIEGWYKDSQLSSSVTPTYSSTASGDKLYVKWRLAEKNVVINPTNGDTPYEITVYRDASKNSFDLPVWNGYEIVSWHTDRECSGEGVALNFDALEDGRTYYAKWQACQ